MLTLTREGRRTYISGDTRIYRNELKEAGAHWDPEKVAWWIGSHAVAEALVARLCTPEKTEAVKAETEARMLERDKAAILGRAKYQEKTYYLVGEGFSESRGRWCRLLFRDGSKTFFADASKVTILKRYEREMSLSRLQEYADEQKSGKGKDVATQDHGGLSKYCSSPGACSDALSWDAPDRLCNACGRMYDRMGY